MTDADPGADTNDEVARIVEAAWDVLQRTGYDALKVQAVARLAGVSIGSFYRHFEGKRELIAALLTQELRRATAVLEEVTAEGTAIERVRAWIDAVVSLRYGKRAGPRARWIVTLPEEISSIVSEQPSTGINTSAPLKRAIADGVADGSFPHADPDRDARLIQALCSHVDRTRTEIASDREATVQYVCSFVLAALTNTDRPPAPS